MTDRRTLEDWIERYIAAARSDDPALIKALFTEDARYFDGPFGEPWKGHEEILEKWVAQSDTDYEFQVSHQVVAVDGSLGVAEMEYAYEGPGYKRTYRNVWLIELDDDGRARTFKDYWVEDPATVPKD